MLPEQLTGFLLHRRAYRETSYLTDLFTLELGKVSAVAKGVRGNKGDKKSLLQSFQPLLLSLSGKHELRNLNQFESAGSMLKLVGYQLFSAMYLNELLNRLLPKEVPHPELFHSYQQSLQWLANDGEIEPCLRQFELLLLGDMGYGFDLTQDYENGQLVEAGIDYCLVLENGIKRAEYSAQGSNRFDGEALLQVSNNVWTPNSLQCAKRITRMALSPLLGHKPLKSRELFQQTWSTTKVNNIGNVK
ncbi:DNA repair protein RecO [Paraglaciecola arctica]|uniref:DNA repair protein RecO n=1 Tax=Paraglaciecola arctica TaxID=1128911 RepID=UPI001C070193|nr:DNA repair protein RecO [Paraglaciecola arctica]MBU3004499.1 DNA repair protein RecO [Paraglaciecola arctica]